MTQYTTAEGVYFGETSKEHKCIKGGITTHEYRIRWDAKVMVMTR